jgi:hypothetical protein
MKQIMQLVLEYSQFPSLLAKYIKLISWAFTYVNAGP